MKKFLFITLIILFLFISCKTMFSNNYQDQETTFFKKGKTFTDNPKDRELVKKDEVILRDKIKKIIGAIVEKEPSIILEQVHEKIGIEVDAKATVSKSKFSQMLIDENNYLNILLWNQKELKKRNLEIEIFTFQNIFNGASNIKINLFFYNEKECEIQLSFKNRPSAGILGNPIYHKIDNKWYLRKFF